MDSSGWCTIESDPGVFTEMISRFGVKDVQVEELWNLESETFDRLKGGVLGLIFLFKWDKNMQKAVGENVLDETPEEVFFARQMINNACATQAILNILLNCDDKVDLGDDLKTFRTFTTGLDPESAGLSLNDCGVVRTAHNSFRRPEPIQIEHSKDDDEDDAFHFISYVPKNGIVYELDGLQKGPRLISDYTSEQEEANRWFEVAIPTIQDRISQYEGGELRFTLLAVTRDLSKLYQEELETLREKTDAESAQRIEFLQNAIQDDKEKKEKWKIANIRRRHNYFPFVFNLLRVLSQKGVLQGMTERATKKKAEELERKKAEEKAKEDKGDKTDADGDVAMAE